MKKRIILSILAMSFVCSFSSCKIENEDKNYTQKGLLMYNYWEEHFFHFEHCLDLAFNFNAWLNATAEKDSIQYIYFNSKEYIIKNTGANQWFLINKCYNPSYLITTNGGGLEGSPEWIITEYGNNYIIGDSLQYRISKAPAEGALPIWKFQVMTPSSEKNNDNQIEKFEFCFTIPELSDPHQLPISLINVPLTFLNGTGILKVDNKYEYDITPTESAADHLEFTINESMHSKGILEPLQFDTGELILRAYNQFGKSKTTTVNFMDNSMIINYNNHTTKYGEGGFGIVAL